MRRASAGLTAASALFMLVVLYLPWKQQVSGQFPLEIRPWRLEVAGALALSAVGLFLLAGAWAVRPGLFADEWLGWSAAATVGLAAALSIGIGRYTFHFRGIHLRYEPAYGLC